MVDAQNSGDLNIDPKILQSLLSGDSKDGLKLGGLKDPYVDSTISGLISFTPPTFIPPFEAPDITRSPKRYPQFLETPKYVSRVPQGL